MNILELPVIYSLNPVENEPLNLLEPSFVTAFTTPLIAFPYSALNVPVITSRSWITSGSILSIEDEPPKTSSICIPSTR